MRSNPNSQIFGRLGSILLSDLIQLLGINRRTVTLVLDRNGESARLFFKDGRVLHAQMGSIEGEDALPTLLDWADATFVVEDGIVDLPKITISKDTEALMLASFTKIDQARKHNSQGNLQPGSVTTTRAGIGSGAVERRYPRPKRSPRLRRRTNVLEYTAAGVAGVCLITFLSYFLVLGGFAFASFRPWSELPPVQVPPSSSDTGVIHLAGLLPPNAVEEFLFAEAFAKEGGDRDTELVGRARPELANRMRPPAADTSRADENPSQPAGLGYLLVVVEPWAEVVIDGEGQGETPLGSIQLSAGEHTVTLSNRDFAGVITDRVTISANDTVTRKYSFQEFGYLQIVVRPWADVFIDGRPAGQTPMGKVKVPTGKHTVLLRHPELPEQNTTTVIDSGETTVVSIEM